MCSVIRSSLLLRYVCIGCISYSGSLAASSPGHPTFSVSHNVQLTLYNDGTLIFFLLLTPIWHFHFLLNLHGSIIIVALTCMYLLVQSAISSVLKLSLPFYFLYLKGVGIITEQHTNNYKFYVWVHVSAVQFSRSSYYAHVIMGTYILWSLSLIAWKTFGIGLITTFSAIILCATQQQSTYWKYCIIRCWKHPLTSTNSVIFSTITPMSYSPHPERTGKY